MTDDGLTYPAEAMRAAYEHGQRDLKAEILAALRTSMPDAAKVGQIAAILDDFPKLPAPPVSPAQGEPK
jgi:hypothetical protein